MTLTKGGKDWLATYAGSNGCFQPSGISYKDADGVSHTGSTGDVANALYVAHLVGKDDVEIVAGKSYSDFRSANGGNDLTLDDVGWVYDNDGDPGEPQYCIATPTPPPTTPTPPPTTPTPGPRRTHKLTVRSDPSGASIYIDGKDTYRLTPETFELEEGTYEVEVVKEGYEGCKWTVNLYSDITKFCTLRRITPTPAPPIEIEVRRGEVKGRIRLSESRIPHTITVGSTHSFRIRVENPSDGITSNYKVTLEFVGTGDVAGKRYTFSSDWSGAVEPGKGISLYVDVLLPSDALADSVAYYELWITLEGRRA